MKYLCCILFLFGMVGCEQNPSRQASQGASPAEGATLPPEDPVDHQPYEGSFDPILLDSTVAPLSQIRDNFLDDTHPPFRFQEIPQSMALYYQEDFWAEGFIIERGDTFSKGSQLFFDKRGF